MRYLLVTLGLALSAILSFAETAGGIKWTAPAAWKAQAPRPMRAATYTVPKVAGDPEDGECAVFYFGAGQGGGVNDNIQRWIGQFEAPGGGPSDKLAKTSKGMLNGLPVTRVDLAGTYKAAAGPMMKASGSKPGYRMLGAIVEGPQGAVFFKFTAPAKTAAAHQPEFERLLQSISR
jgi:hypothetical protein